MRLFHILLSGKRLAAEQYAWYIAISVKIDEGNTHIYTHT
jgi:hypothetical protein